MSILYNLYIVYLTLFSVLFFPSCYILSNNGYEINNDRHKWIHFQDLLIIMFNSLDVYILKYIKLDLVVCTQWIVLQFMYIKVFYYIWAWFDYCILLCFLIHVLHFMYHKNDTTIDVVFEVCNKFVNFYYYYYVVSNNFVTMFRNKYILFYSMS